MASAGWQKWLDEQRELVLATNLPARVFSNAHLLKDFLSLGQVKGADVQIQDLTDEQLFSLDRLGDKYCEMCGDHWQTGGWVALAKELIRRGHSNHPVAILHLSIKRKP